MISPLKIIKPDDWHLHLRDGAMLQSVAPISARHFARAIIMPNLVPPIVSVDDAASYRQRILSALPEGSGFEPFMTLYLTEKTSPDEIEKAARCGFILALKLYPAGATTNSDFGVKNFNNVLPTLEKMAELAIPLCVHGEVVDSQVDIFDREAVFIERVLDPIRRKIPDLRIVFEHITTRDGVDYTRDGGPDIAGTITAHHLIINRNHILAGGIHPHYYCLPVAKRECHRLALLQAATSGDKQFFLGTDSAPHLDDAKLNSCGCAGVFSALNAMSCLAHIFEKADALENLEGFTSKNGAGFYRLPENRKTITLTKNDTPVSLPSRIDTQDGPLTVFDPGFTQYWSIE